MMSDNINEKVIFKDLNFIIKTEKLNYIFNRIDMI